MDHFSLPLLRRPFPITNSLTDLHIANFKIQKANRLQCRKINFWINRYLMPNLFLLWFSSWGYPICVHVHTHTDTQIWHQHSCQRPNEEQRPAGERSVKLSRFHHLLEIPTLSLATEIRLFHSDFLGLLSILLTYGPFFWRWYSLINTQSSFYAIGS